MDRGQKKFLVSEYALLQKDARKAGGTDAVLGDIREHNRDAEEFAASEKFDASVNDIEQVRFNLANPDLDVAVGSFRYSQTDQGQEEAKKKLAQKTSSMLKDSDTLKKALEERAEKKKEEIAAVPKV